jgi:hypothetical protein
MQRATFMGAIWRIGRESDLPAALALCAKPRGDDSADNACQQGEGAVSHALKLVEDDCAAECVDLAVQRCNRAFRALHWLSIPCSCHPRRLLQFRRKSLALCPQRW